MGLHYLAWQLGMTVDQLCTTMTAAEFQRWERFFVQRAEAASKATAEPEIALANLGAEQLKAMF